MVNFVAVDIETANADLGSVCQIGLVQFDEEKILDSWGTLVNPEDHFSHINVGIHGIHEIDAKTAPIFPQIYEQVRNRLKGTIAVSHTAFDRVSLARVTRKYDLPDFECIWLDTAKVVRRAWSDFADRGFGLHSVADHLGIVFTHHDAKEDARVAGEILLRAMKETGLSVQDWLDRTKRPSPTTRAIDPSSPSKITLKGEPNGPLFTLEGNPEGPLFGEVIVFTGALSISRKQAAEMAAKTGCKVGTSVTKETTILVIGDQDIRKLAGREKSSKHRKAEELIAKGETIRIVGESDFQRLLAV